jgi:hypothetical protein
MIGVLEIDGDSGPQPDVHVYVADDEFILDDFHSVTHLILR